MLHKSKVVQILIRFYKVLLGDFKSEKSMNTHATHRAPSDTGTSDKIRTKTIDYFISNKYMKTRSSVTSLSLWLIWGHSQSQNGKPRCVSHVPASLYEHSLCTMSRCANPPLKASENVSGQLYEACFNQLADVLVDTLKLCLLHFVTFLCN